MPAVPVSLIEPIWAEFAMLLPDRPALDPTHPLGCHRRRVPDRVVFDHVVDAMVHGSDYERIASPGCSDRTIRRRMHEWAAAGPTPQLHALVLTQYDRRSGWSWTMWPSTAASRKHRVEASRRGEARWIEANRGSNARL